MTFQRTCPRLFAMSARNVQHILAPMLSQVHGLESRPRVGFRVVENSRGDFVFGTLLSWGAPTSSDSHEAGIHTGIDNVEGAEAVLASFLGLALSRLRDGVLVHGGIADLLNLLRRHRGLPEAKALLPHVEVALDMGMVFDALLPTNPVTLEAIGERIAGIPPHVQGTRCGSKASELKAPAALVQLARSCGDPRIAWERVLKMPPSEWADEWVIDESPVWGELLVEDGELRMARLRELDRWLMDEVMLVKPARMN